MSLTIDTIVKDNQANVAVVGEVDVSNANELGDVLGDLVDKKTKVIAIDMSEVPYIDSTGIGVLVAAAHKATEADGEMIVSKPQPNVLRVLTLLGVGSEFHVQEG